MTGGPTILVALDRALVDQLVPGGIADAERLGQGFADAREREMWIAGRLGVFVGAAIERKSSS